MQNRRLINTEFHSRAQSPIKKNEKLDKALDVKKQFVPLTGVLKMKSK